MHTTTRPQLRLVSNGASKRDEPPSSKTPTNPLADLPDPELVALGLQGNRKALEALYRRHASYAINLAARVQGSVRDTDDVVHDAFIKAFQSLRDLRDPSAFKSWLGAIVVKSVRKTMRHARFLRYVGLGGEGEAVDLNDIAGHAASPSDRAQIAQIYALLRTQPVDNRIAWILHEVEGIDIETISRLTNTSSVTVKRRISRACRFLDECFVDSNDSVLPNVDGGACNAKKSENSAAVRNVVGDGDRVDAPALDSARDGVTAHRAGVVSR